MGRIYGGREAWVRISNRFRLVQRKPFCTNKKPTTTTNPNHNSDKADGSLSQHDAFRDLDKLDFMTAAKILFTTPPKKKKFGIDFHLVQLFFACMPSLAVYLVALYARHEMRRMEAELELKKQAEEATKAKEMELKAAEEKEAGFDPELLDVKERLGKLEEAVKEIVVESKKQSGSTIAKNKEGGNEKKQPSTTINTRNTSKASNSEAEDHLTSGSTPVADASKQDQQATQDGRFSPEEKK